MKYLSFCLLLATAVPLAAQTPSPKGGDKIIPEPIILNACVTAGAEKNSYMLSNVIRADQPVGTSGSARARAAANAFYWLDKGSKLKDHVGHQVQVTGMLDDDVDKTATKNTKDGKVEVTSERTKKVEVPEGSAAAAGAGVDGSERLSYKVKVHSVTRLPGSCQQ